MRPVSLLQIKAHSDTRWTVTQKFERLGKPVTVYAWGFSRKDALKQFEDAKYWKSLSEPDSLQDFANWIMDIVDWIERRIK